MVQSHRSLFLLCLTTVSGAYFMWSEVVQHYFCFLPEVFFWASLFVRVLCLVFFDGKISVLGFNRLGLLHLVKKTRI